MMHQLLLITVLFGIGLIVKVDSVCSRKNRGVDTTSCRRFLDTRTALVCSQTTELTDDAPSEKLDCGTGTVINVVAIYAGLKHTSTAICPDNSNQTSGYKPKCCQKEQTDYLINVDDIKEQLKGKGEYERLRKATQNCEGKHECSVPSVVIPVINGLAWRNYSNFILVEYRCSRDDDQDSSLQRGRALTCSYKVTSAQDPRADDLECTDGMVINVISVYVGLKGNHANDCPKVNTSVSVNNERCCQYDDRDFIFDACCLRDQQTSNVSYVKVLETAAACNGENNCRIPSHMLPSLNSATTRNYSSYIVVEYTCDVARHGEDPTTEGNGENSEDTVRTTPIYGDTETSFEVTPFRFPILTIGLIVGGILLAAALTTWVLWLRKRRSRGTSIVHVHTEGELAGPGPTTEGWYTEIPLSDEVLYDDAEPAMTNPKVDDTYIHAVADDGCIASAEMKGSDAARMGSGSQATPSASKEAKTSGADATYENAAVGRGTAAAEDGCNAKSKGSDAARMGSASDAGHTTPTEVTTHGVDFTYENAAVGTGSSRVNQLASMKGEISDGEHTYMTMRRSEV